MRIDSHQHFWSLGGAEYSWLEGDAMTPIRRDFGPSDLAPELEQCGVTHTLLVQTRSSLEETEEFLDYARDTPYIAGVVGWVDLTDPGVGEVLDALLEGPNGRFLVGIRHGVQSETDPMWLLQTDVNRGLEHLSVRKLVYDLLITARDVPAALIAARAHPELTFVIDHAAKPDLKAGHLEFERWKTSLEPFAALPNVFIKLSGLVTEADWKHWTPAQIGLYLKACLQQFGPERCMYGSDWPVCLLAASYGQTLELVMNSLEGYGEIAQNASRPDRRPSPEGAAFGPRQCRFAQDAVLGETAARVYRLKEKDLLL